MKVLKVNLKAPCVDDHFIVKLRNGKAKVTLVRIEADRNEYVGTYLNVASMNVDTFDGMFVASIRDGMAGGINQIERVGRTLSCKLEKA